MNRQFIYLQYSPKNQRTVGKKTENRYPTGSIQQSGGNIFRKWLSDQGKFSVIREGKNFKIVNQPCSLT